MGKGIYFIKSKKVTMILTGIIISLVASSVIFVTSQDQKKAENLITEPNKRSSQVLVTGKDYKIDKKQQKLHSKQQKQFAKIKQEEEKHKKSQKKKESAKGDGSNKKDKSGKGKSKGDSNPHKDKSDKNDNEVDPGDDKKDDKPEPPDQSENPGEEPQKPEDNDLSAIETNLKDGSKINGDRVSFWVRATDKHGRYIKLNVRENIEVKRQGGDRETSTKQENNNTKYTYVVDLEEGNNTIQITTPYKQKAYSVICDPSGEREVTATITFSLEAATIGKGMLIKPMKVDVYEGEQMSYVVERALKDQGFESATSGTPKNGYYVSGVYKNGITKGYKIPKHLEEELEKEGANWTTYDDDSLCEGNFTSEAGWMFDADGHLYESGFSGYYPNDGDKVRLRFSLCQARDLGFSKNGKVIGDW